MFKKFAGTFQTFAKKKAAWTLLRFVRKQLPPLVQKMRKNTSNCVLKVASNVAKQNVPRQNESRT